MCKFSLMFLLLTMTLQIAAEKNNKVSNDVSQKMNLDNPKYASEFINMDRKFLSNITGKSNAIVTGKYLLCYQFPNEDEKKHKLFIRVNMNNNAIDLVRIIPEPHPHPSYGGNFWKKNNAVYWDMYLPDINFHPPIDFVGLIDGDTIWGHIYRINWEPDGWHPTTFNIGVFKITPLKPEDEKELMKTKSNKKNIKTNTPNTPNTDK